MASFLESSERTTYRYIDLLKQLGFEVQKDEHNKLFIPSDKQTDEQYMGLFVFTDCSQLSKYDYLNTQKSSGLSNSGQYTSVRDNLIKRVKKKTPNANAII